MYRLNEEQQRVVADAAAVADATIAPQAARVDADAAFPQQSIAALGESGLLGLTVPAAYGGLGHGLRTMAATIDTVAQRCSSTAMVYLMHLCGVACYASARRTRRRIFSVRRPRGDICPRSHSASRDRAAISGRR